MERFKPGNFVIRDPDYINHWWKSQAGELNLRGRFKVIQSTPDLVVILLPNGKSLEVAARRMKLVDQRFSEHREKMVSYANF